MKVFSLVLIIFYASGSIHALSDQLEALGPNERLMPGEQMRSLNGVFTLTMQKNGDLVLRQNLGIPDQEIWSTQTGGNLTEYWEGRILKITT